MVERQLRARGITDGRVLAAMAAVPREAFVSPDLATEAYADRPLPIGAGQTISQPYMVAVMAEAARIGPGDRVLEVGAGCGYAVAVLSRLAAEVHAVERLPDLAKDARRRLADLGCTGASVHLRDGTEGLPEAAPFDAIIVSAGGKRVPPALKRQLAEGGRLVVPVGPPGAQALLRLVRHGDAFDEEDLGPVSFVPLVEGVEGAGREPPGFS